MSLSDQTLEMMTVNDVLKKWPLTAQVFRAHHLSCMTCAVSTFCEVTTVADIYGLPKASFLAELRAIIKQYPTEE